MKTHTALDAFQRFYCTFRLIKFDRLISLRNTKRFSESTLHTRHSWDFFVLRGIMKLLIACYFKGIWKADWKPSKEDETGTILP